MILRIALVVLLIPTNLWAQNERPWAGDTPAVAPPLATDLSPRLTRKNVVHAIEKVADWQLAEAQPRFNQDWTFAALYVGFMAVPKAASGNKYQAAMLEMGRKFDWQPGPRVAHADDAAVGQTYLDLYFRYHDPAMMAPIRERMDKVMALPDDPQKPLWWWCDALFMAPPVLSKLRLATREMKYLNFMDHEWWITSRLLYSPANHLYFRDASYLDKHQANGKSIFWSRGNGWVFAALARVLQEMPADYPSRPRYVAQFKEMAEELATLQGADGLWRPGLLDPAAYPLPEVSGSAFFTFGFAWGINHGVLERAKYQPIVEKAWSGLLSHIYQDGRLGCIQPIGAAPGDYQAATSYVFGTGAFLLAGSEVYRLAH
ncbi:MAG TPA: glycoside hydrolase family 88 protein [Acidobacteriaceae bacterium]|nr:glycoside hydrolase family 88 protein [Acidobacteriaceae bacterium]